MFFCFIFLQKSFTSFWLHGMACGILVPQLGMKPTPFPVEAERLNHWTNREVPKMML